MSNYTKATDFGLSVSFVEVYMDEVFDLLDGGSKIKLRECREVAIHASK